MIERFENLAINTSLDQISEGLNEGDWLKMSVGAHSLKGAAGYSGTGRIYYMCCYIMSAYRSNDFQSMIQQYPLLVETCIEYKRFARKFLAGNDCKFFNWIQLGLCRLRRKRECARDCARSQLQDLVRPTD